MSAEKCVLRLKHDVGNPRPDRRFKSDVSALVYWPKGSLWKYFPPSVDAQGELRMLNYVGALYEDDPGYQDVSGALEELPDYPTNRRERVERLEATAWLSEWNDYSALLRWLYVQGYVEDDVLEDALSAMTAMSDEDFEELFLRTKEE